MFSARPSISLSLRIVEEECVDLKKHRRQRAEQQRLEKKALERARCQQESSELALLRSQQEHELQESLRIDQEKARKREETERQREFELWQLIVEQQKQEEESQARLKRLERKRARLPEEPPSDEPGRILLQIKLPSGKRLRRSFIGDENTVGQVHDFIDVESCNELIDEYRLVSTMPRKEFVDRELSLVAAGLQSQQTLWVESLDA